MAAEAATLARPQAVAVCSAVCWARAAVAKLRAAAVAKLLQAAVAAKLLQAAAVATN